MKRKKKRKLPDLAKKHEEKASKSSRITQPSDVLVLSLQKKNIDIEKKVELAYKFVKLSLSQVEDDTTQASEAVSFERVIIFLNNWVQSTLISSEKEIRVEKLKPQYGVSGSCLDYRCWEIFKFCLEQGTKLHVSMSFARDILKVVHCIAKNTEIKDFSDDELMLYNTMLDCISSIFTSHGGVSNESLDLWILLVGTLLELVLKVITSKLECSKTGIIVLNWTCLVLEPFAKFLRLHPNRKNGFHDFVDRLLEPFLCLMYVLPSSVLANESAWMSEMSKRSLVLVAIVKCHHVSALSAEIRKSLFDFFVQIMEPFLGDIDTYLQDELEVGSVLEDVHRTLKSTNSILVSLMEEKVYVRVDDTSEGACANFLKLICDKIRLLSAKVGQLVPSTFDVNSGTCQELVEVVAKELILCLHYLLQIDYEVLGKILHLGCHMINLYSELRQVGTSVFALCKAIRQSWRSYHEAWTKSLRSIICSPELRLSIHNAVKSIPEGQRFENSCQDSSSSSCFRLKAEVLGSGLSEVYALVLDSVMVTTKLIPPGGQSSTSNRLRKDVRRDARFFYGLFWKRLRLVDLNRLMNSFAFVIKRNEMVIAKVNEENGTYEDGWNFAVAAIDKKSLPSAFWCIFARTHRSEISLELLSNTMLYEEKLVRRHMASRFCRFLEELVPPLFAMELLVGTLLGNNDASSVNDRMSSTLLLCCRKTLKHLMVTFCDENMEVGQKSLGALHFGGKFPALWLLHSYSRAAWQFVHASHYLISAREAFPEGVPALDQENRANQRELKHGFYDPGFLWGLSSTLSHMDAQNINLKAIFLRRKFEPVDKLKLCIDTFTSFINTFLCELVLQDDKWLKESDSQHGYKYTFLRSLLDGENLEAAFFLRQLFLAYSALLRLNSQIKTSLSPNLVNTFIGISEILLLEFSNNTKHYHNFLSYSWMGSESFLKNWQTILLNQSLLPTDIYERLIDLHLKAIGKCISLQGKEATLESHETESSMKTMDGPLGLSECGYSRGPSSLDELKSRLRMSFKVFVRKPSESYVSSALQSIKKALVGLQKGSMVNYQIYTGSTGGGKASSIVAAGIDCFDIVLEAITGRKNLTTVKTDILGSVACLFNIITHLQGPRIFYKDPVSNIQFHADPDPGSVVLMCIEVLTKVSGKHALYQMDACYVAQALSTPATLFQNILKYTTSEAPNIESVNEGMNTKLFDRQYSIELYAACCRMLYTFLRHHKRESLQHIALLQASVSVLLHCLEMVNNEQSVRKSYVVWGVQEGAKCGAFLRRIYEEIRQQKDVLGQYCRLFLSSYVVVYSGCGPLKAGIKREVDEALRPGVYALIDACSPDDLQYIHTVLGEGPCRKTLANLQHDYKLNFQYEGKV
ncbi:hypothetical protein OSB04_015714 [Centaurea solstitialis]|uniref:Nucleolar 27S pre-rRNA processing Urb2/Npa2 C-terminal domain-containing protein n=1 Tax=Centaurea solstitialis TaxID=347529 RepID=A0AA38SZK1_9ASTR|nr:hypothetical protein OSB04_015714 [Centaurea solstitialis]